MFIASKALLADYFQSVQRGGDRALVVVCGGHAVMYHVNLALTMNKTQRKVQRQRRLCRGIAKGCSLQVKRCLRSVFKACREVAIVRWWSYVAVVRWCITEITCVNYQQGKNFFCKHSDTSANVSAKNIGKRCGKIYR